MKNTLHFYQVLKTPLLQALLSQRHRGFCFVLKKTTPIMYTSVRV
ncbi:hypothetical protein [Acinetobacter baumannii]|nr:hypothetical protein [Acinetobacter baumannii]